jgi:hypothetical protein
MKTYKLYIYAGSGRSPVQVTVQARDPGEARRIAEAQYGKGSIANGGYIEQVR